MKKENLIRQESDESVKSNTAFLDKLKQELPSFFTKDEEFDIEKFKRALQENNVDELKDGYQLRFIGKDYARRQAGERPHTVIVPDNVQNTGEGKNSKNLFFSGDNLEVLRHLQRNYTNKIDVIYIDPPYNTGGDGFAYPDKFEYSDEQLKEMFGINDDEISRLKSIQGRSSHSAWLTFMYPRLALAKNLLSEKGVIFISIDDNEQANLKMMMDEIFGEANLVTQLAVQMSKTQGNKVKAAKKGNIVKNKEFILVYSKNFTKETNRQVLYDHVSQYDDHYSYYLKDDGTLGKLMDVLKKEDTLTKDIEALKKLKRFSIKNLGFFMDHSEKITKFIYENSNLIFRDAQANIKIPSDVEEKVKKLGKTSPYKFQSNDNKEYLLISVGSGTIRQLLPLSETYHQSDDFKSVYGRSTIRGDWWPDFNLDMMNVAKEDDIEYKNGKKPIRLIKQLLKWSGLTNGIVLDFFAGSATTASAVIRSNIELDTNNKFIMVQLPENLDERYKQADSNGKKDIKKLIKILDENHRPHFIDEIGQQRIVNVSKKIEKEYEKNQLEKVDSSFKHYTVVKATRKLLDDIEEFDDNALFTDMLDSFSSDALGVNSSADGLDTVLTTWLVNDGYPFDVEVKNLALGDYKAQLIDDNRLYLIDSGWNTENTEELVNLIGKNQLQVQSIVLFGYSFTSAELYELEIAIKQLNNTVNLITRY